MNIFLMRQKKFLEIFVLSNFFLEFFFCSPILLEMFFGLQNFSCIFLKNFNQKTTKKFLQMENKHRQYGMGPYG